MRSASAGANEMLTAETEKQLLKAWRERGENGALDRLVRAFDPLCRRIARTYMNRAPRTPADDIRQEARLGLLDAIARYDVEQNTRLATYAQFWIHERLHSYTLEGDQLIRVPRNTQQKVTRVTSEQRHNGDDTPSMEAVKAEAHRRYGLREDVAADAYGVLANKHVASLDAPVGHNDDHDGDQTGLDRLVDAGENPETEVIERYVWQGYRKDLENALNRLPTRSAHIVRAHLLQENPETYAQIGARMNLSKERIRQIEQEALKDLQRLLNSRHRTRTPKNSSPSGVKGINTKHV